MVSSLKLSILGTLGIAVAVIVSLPEYATTYLLASGLALIGIAGVTYAADKNL